METMDYTFIDEYIKAVSKETDTKSVTIWKNKFESSLATKGNYTGKYILYYTQKYLSHVQSIDYLEKTVFVFGNKEDIEILLARNVSGHTSQNIRKAISMSANILNALLFKDLLGVSLEDIANGIINHGNQQQMFDFLNYCKNFGYEVSKDLLNSCYSHIEGYYNYKLLAEFVLKYGTPDYENTKGFIKTHFPEEIEDFIEAYYQVKIDHLHETIDDLKKLYSC